MSVRIDIFRWSIDQERSQLVTAERLSPDQPASRTSRRSAAVDSVTLRMFTDLTSRNCPTKSEIGVSPRIYRFVTANVMKLCGTFAEE